MTTTALVGAVGSHSAALLVLVAQSCLGARLLGWMRLDESLSIHERLLFGWAAGFALTTLAWMGLASGALLGPVSVSCVTLLAIAISWPVPRTLGWRVWTVLHTADRPTQLAVGLGLGALALWAWPFWVESLLPNSDWDSALYHLPLAERYLDGSLWGRDPYFPAFAFPGAVHLLYAALMAVGLESAITPLNFQITLLTLVATLVLARKIGNRWSPVWASVAFSTTPILWQLGLDARIDGFLVFSLALAVYAIVRFAQEGHDNHLALAALALGAAAGCKYTAIPYVVVLGAIGLGFRLWGPRGSEGLTRVLATSALLVAVPSASWYLANLAIHGDPFFPMLRGEYILSDSEERIHLPRAREELEPQRLDAEIQEPDFRSKLRAFEALPESLSPTHLFDLAELLRSPDRYAVKPLHAIGPLLLLSLALPLALPVVPEKRRAAILVWLLGWGSYLALGSQTGLLRYAAPALPLLAAVTGVLISHARWSSLRIVLALAALLLFARDFQAQQRKLELLQPERVLGADPSPWRDRGLRIEWLKQVGFNFTPPMAYVVEELEKSSARGELSEDCGVFMVGEGKGRLLPCRSWPDSSWFAHRFLGELQNASFDPKRVALRLREQGVTHVLYNRAYYDWVVTDTDTARSRVAFVLTHLERFLSAHARLVLDAGGLRLYELREADPR